MKHVLFPLMASTCEKNMEELKKNTRAYFYSTKCDKYAFGTYGVWVKGVMLYSNRLRKTQNIFTSSFYLFEVETTLKSSEAPSFARDNQPANNFQTN